MFELILQRKEFVFGKDKPFESAHASTLLPLDGERVLAAAFGGSWEGKDDVDIWVASSCARSGFQDPVRISYDKELPHWNPVLERGAQNEITLYFKVGREIPSWKTYFCQSFDNAKTWSAIRELVCDDDSGGRGPVKNKTLRLSSGALLAPASLENATDWWCFIDRSEDNGASWEKIEVRKYQSDGAIEEMKDKKIPKGVIQPTLWESGDGNVHMLLRSTYGRIYRSDSQDYGKTWSEIYATQLPNNNSGIDIAKGENGILALALNPVAGNWGKRTPLCLYLSEDNGHSFYEAFTLESEDGEFSYPAIVSSKNEFHVTYTWNRKNIVYSKLILNQKILHNIPKF